jgi:hypothetical protein
MKKTIVASIIVCLLAGFAYNVADAATKSTKPMQGQIVSLDDIIKSVKDLQLTKAKAEELYKNGSPLVFYSNKKVYFVQNEDGSFAFKKLSNYAHNKKVGIVGTKKTIKGINVIVMSKIESMD